tara:strand:- start:113 stop:268 length:156 start_codon:yes stop_codon:yes gene_type:complete
MTNTNQMSSNKRTYKLFIDGKYKELTETEFFLYEKRFLKQFEFKKLQKSYD